MLTQSVEAERLYELDILFHSFIIFGKENTVGKITLVEQCVEEIRFTIQCIPPFVNINSPDSPQNLKA